METTYTVRYVHKIAPSEKDTGPAVQISEGDLSDAKRLGRVLRAAGVLAKGARVHSFRMDAGRLVVFPSLPGLTTYWHSVILTPIVLDSFTRAYLTAALWVGTDESNESGGNPLDDKHGIEDFAPSAIVRAAADCARFQAEQAEALASATCTARHECTDLEYAGHDFWLTRNGHGCGFWDGDWSEPEATLLDNACKAFGSCDIVLSEGRIYLE